MALQPSAAAGWAAAAGAAARPQQVAMTEGVAVEQSPDAADREAVAAAPPPVQDAYELPAQRVQEA